MDEKCYWIWLSKIENVNSKTLQYLIEKYKEPQQIWNKKLNELLLDGIDFYTAYNLTRPMYKENLNQSLEYVNQNNISIITYKDEKYPGLLRNIYDFPICLYVKGNVEILNENYIGIVGSRNCTEYGKQTARKFAYGLSKKNVCIVSGLARGIDTYAHIGCIEANIGKTVAVLGSGLDEIYPYENKMLYEKIIKTGGAIISEYPIGTKPYGKNFPRRNRIISGMSQGIIVVEASKKSGSLITVDFALEQGKNVYAVPGNITSTHSVGTNELIKEGAIPVTCVEDVVI